MSNFYQDIGLINLVASFNFHLDRLNRCLGIGVGNCWSWAILMALIPREPEVCVFNVLNMSESKIFFTMI